MKNRLISAILIAIMTTSLSGCSLTEIKSKVFSKTDEIKAENKDLPQLTKELMNNYNAIIKDVENKLPKGANAEDVYDAKFEAVYNEVFAKEADALSKGVDVDEQDIQNYLSNKANKKPVRVVVVYSKDGKSTYDYRLYSDNPYAEQDIGEEFLGLKVKEVRKVTEDDLRLEAVKNISASRLVARVNERTKQVLNIKNKTIKLDE